MEMKLNLNWLLCIDVCASVMYAHPARMACTSTTEAVLSIDMHTHRSESRKGNANNDRVVTEEEDRGRERTNEDSSAT